MANWYYYNESGDKIEVTGGQLKGLAKAGRITPDTIVETEDGKKARAGKVKGLTFAVSESVESPIADIPEAEKTVIAPPVAAQPVPMPQVAPPTANVFCTNCGNPIAENAVACMSCGAKPTGHKKFCRHCGVALNPEQVICIKCGARIEPVQPVPSPVVIPTSFAQSPQTISSPLADHPTFGKVLASGNGKGNPAIIGIWVSMILLSVIMMGLFIVLSYSIKEYSDLFAKSSMVAASEGKWDEGKKDAEVADFHAGLSFWVFIASFIIPLIAIVFAVIISGIIARSEVTVYENGLTGITGFPTSSVFQLTHDKIISVMVRNSTLIIRVSERSYMCYITTPLVAEEIYRVIVNRHNELQLPALSEAPAPTPMK